MKIIFKTTILLLFINTIDLGNGLFKYRDDQVVQTILEGVENKLNFERYLDNDQLDLFMSIYNYSNPNLVRIDVIGVSAQGRPLKVMVIRNKKNDRQLDLKPTVKLIANQYGNEAVGRQILIYLAQFLLENYPDNEVIRNIIDTTEIQILFTMNPDGFDQSKEGDCQVNTTDRIGKFPDQYDLNPHIFYENYTNGSLNLWMREGIKIYNGRRNKSETNKLEPEVEAVERWSLNNRFLLSLDLHSGLMGIFYPYSRLKQVDNRTPKSNIYLTPDNDLFEMLAFTYAINHPTMNTSECNPLRLFPDRPYPIMNQAFFKPTIGSMQDYNYFFASCLEISVHLACCAYPPRTKLKELWHENKVSIVNHLRLVHMGIKGFISDAFTNQGLEGVFVIVHGIQHITISDEQGRYFRILPEGKYRVTFELSQYKNTTIVVLVDNLLNQANPFNVKMYKDYDEFKAPSVIKALNEESSNSLNQSFDGKLKLIANDFKSVPVFKYHSNDEMIGYLLYYHQKYSKITHLYKIEGHDESNKRLPFAMVISTKPEQHTLLKPEMKYSANSFPNDWIGKELLLLLVKHLLESYDHNEEIQKLINTTRIHIIPSMDPEAYEKYLNSQINSSPSKTPQNDICLTDESVSIDTCFPDRITSRSPAGFESDRIRFMEYFDEIAFILSGSFYDGQLLARLPMNAILDSDKTAKTEEDDLYHELAASYVNANKKMLLSKGCPNDPCTRKYNLSNKIVNGTVVGADWRKRNNTMQDYLHAFPFCLDISFFISCEKMPDPVRLIDYWLDNRVSLINFIKQANRGIKGLIIDAATNTTLFNLDLRIQIEGTNQTKSIVYSKGDYFRILGPGTYNVSIYTTEYESKWNEVTVVEGKVTRCDFYLQIRNKSKPETKSNELVEEIKSKMREGDSIKKKDNHIEHHHFMKYSIFTFLFICSLLLLVYYCNQSRKIHLKRGFERLFNKLADDDGFLTDNEMMLGKVEIVNHLNREKSSDPNDFSIQSSKGFGDEIILLDKS